MPMLTLLLWIALIGFGLWLVNVKFPMVDWVKIVFNVVAAIFVIYLVLAAFGLLSVLQAPVPRVR